jgi:hypothetical protein
MEEKKEQRFRGMKKKPYAGLQNGVRDKEKGKVRKKKSRNGTITKAKGLSPYQLRTQEEFLKIREGETTKEWAHRTRFRRIRTEEEIAATAIGKKKIGIFKKKSKQYENSRVRIKVFDKEFNFLKFYIFVINWASIKYNLPQQDLEIGFHFHQNLPFTKAQFCNKCTLFTKNGRTIFNRLRKNGQIQGFYSSQLNRKGEKVKTNMFNLSHSFVMVLNEIYKKITYTTSFDFESNMATTMTPELEKLIIEMATENKDILEGKKEPYKFLIK